jgi:hypothetical protein
MVMVEVLMYIVEVYLLHFVSFNTGTTLYHYITEPEARKTCSLARCHVELTAENMVKNGA